MFSLLKSKMQLQCTYHRVFFLLLFKLHLVSVPENSEKVTMAFTPLCDQHPPVHSTALKFWPVGSSFLRHGGKDFSAEK